MVPGIITVAPSLDNLIGISSLKPAVTSPLAAKPDCNGFLKLAAMVTNLAAMIP
jgi:hypothetical protein